MMIIKNELPLNSRVWVYQASRKFSAPELDQVQEELDVFVAGWEAHNVLLKAKGEIFYDQFIVLFVDEKNQNATGCSIDKSVAFIKSIEQKLGIELMNRMLLTYRDEKEVIQTLTMQAFQSEVQAGKITPETMVFNNLVGTKKEFIEGWEVPAKNSWHKNLFALVK